MTSQKFSVSSPLLSKIMVAPLPTRCQRLATVATLIVWVLAQNRGDGHCSLVTPERVLSECHEDFGLVLMFLKNCNDANILITNFAKLQRKKL